MGRDRKESYALENGKRNHRSFHSKLQIRLKLAVSKLLNQNFPACRTLSQFVTLTFLTKQRPKISPGHERAQLKFMVEHSCKRIMASMG